MWDWDLQSVDDILIAYSKIRKPFQEVNRAILNTEKAVNDLRYKIYEANNMIWFIIYLGCCEYQVFHCVDFCVHIFSPAIIPVNISWSLYCFLYRHLLGTPNNNKL